MLRDHFWGIGWPAWWSAVGPDHFCFDGREQNFIRNESAYIGSSGTLLTLNLLAEAIVRTQVAAG